jgi:putative membrane protein
MSKIHSIPVLAATVLAAAALAGCDRRDDVPRPKTDSPATTAPKAPGAGASSVDRNTTGRAPATVAVQAGDRTFVEKAASAGMAEVAITKHAMDKAASAEVKKIAKHLHTDHTKANQELTKIASSKGITLPAAPEGDKQAEVDQLSKLTGADLDRVVLEKLEKSHRESIKLFEQEAAAGSDPELKAFAGKTLRTLREHLKMVEAGRSGDGGAPSAKK